MSTLQQLQTQRATFVAAYAAHKISKAELDTALSANQQQIDAYNAQQSKTSTPAPTAPPPSVSPLPAETPPQQFTDQSGTTWQNTKPVEKETKVPQNIPTAMGSIPKSTFDAGAKDPTMQQVVIPVLETAAIVGLAAIPGAAPIVLGGAAIGVGADIGIKSVTNKEINPTTGQEEWKPKLVLPASPREVTDTALAGAALSLVGGGAVSAVGKVAPAIVEQTVGRVAVNVGVNAGISGAASGVASSGDSKAILEGAAFGAVLGIGGEAVGAAAGKVASIPKVSNAIQNVKDVTVGSKFTEIVGVKEVNIQTTKGMETTITRITQPELQAVTLKGNDAKFYRENNLGTLQNPKLELAGTQRISTLSKDEAGVLQEITRYNQPVESSRAAEPILSAIKGDTYQAGKVKAGELADFLKTPSDFSAVEKVKIEAGIGSVDLNSNGKLSKATVPVTKLEKVVASNKDAILPVREVSAREFTGVQLRGEVDPKIYADPAKALPTNMAQDIYKELGGGFNQKNYFSDPTVTGKGKKPFSPDVPVGESKLKLGTVDDDLKLVKRGSSAADDSGMQSVAKQVAKSEGKTEIQLPRSIVGEVKGETAALRLTVPVVSTGSKQKQKNMTGLTIGSATAQPDLLTPEIIMPTASRSRPQNIAPAIVPVTFPDLDNRITPKVMPVMEPEQPIINNVPKVPSVGFIPTPSRGVVIIPRLTPGNIPAVTPIQKTPTAIKTDTIPSFVTTPGTTPKLTTPKIRIPSVTKQRGPNLFVPTAGGGGGAGLVTGKTGKWFTKKHKVKTAAQMLKTFGVGGGNSGGTGQGLRVPDLKIGKGFTPKQINFKAANNGGSFGPKQINKMFQQPKKRRR